MILPTLSRFAGGNVPPVTAGHNSGRRRRDSINAAAPVPGHGTRGHLASTTNTTTASATR